jgi:hypothetical protein
MIEENKMLIERTFGIKGEDINDSDTGMMFISVA